MQHIVQHMICNTELVPFNRLRKLIARDSYEIIAMRPFCKTRTFDFYCLKDHIWTYTSCELCKHRTIGRLNSAGCLHMRADREAWQRYHFGHLTVDFTAFKRLLTSHDPLIRLPLVDNLTIDASNVSVDITGLGVQVLKIGCKSVRSEFINTDIINHGSMPLEVWLLHGGAPHIETCGPLRIVCTAKEGIHRYYLGRCRATEITVDAVPGDERHTIVSLPNDVPSSIISRPNLTRYPLFFASSEN